eukprot:3432839-Pyramimonas_sp.AAC.1
MNRVRFGLLLGRGPGHLGPGLRARGARRISGGPGRSPLDAAPRSQRHPAGIAQSIALRQINSLRLAAGRGPRSVPNSCLLYTSPSPRDRSLS